MNKKKSLILIISILSVNLSFAQDSLSNRGWKFGVNISPEFAYRHLKVDDPINPENIKTYDYKKLRDDAEIPMLLFTAGLFTEYRISESISIKTGFHYTLRGAKSKDIGLGSDYNYPGYITNLEKLIYNHQYHYIGIPISGSFYYLNRSKISAFFSLGCDLNYLFYKTGKSTFKYFNENEKVVTYSDPIKKDTDNQGFNFFTPSLMVSTGLDWKFGKKSNLRVEPIYRLSLIQLRKNDLKEYFYNVGINFSYVYSLK